MEEPDPDVIRSAAAGDEAAFAVLVRAYQQHVWRFLRRLLGDDALAEDVAQETFLRLYRRLPSFAFQARFSTWVLQVARNAGIDELRRQQRRDRTAAVTPARPAAAGGADARAELEAALASLPVEMREALLLVELFGLRYREAGLALGVPEGTVKSRVFNARVRLHRWSTAGEAEAREAGP